MKTDFQTTIIIPSYNSQKTIARTIESIHSLDDFHMVHEIIIVDSSDDPYAKALLHAMQSNKIKVITSGIKVMPSIQRNIGAEQAKGDLLVFIDSDACAAHDWLQKIVTAYADGWKAGGGSYLIPDFQKNNRIALAQYYYEFGEFIPYGKSRIKKILPSCNFFCDRSFFLSIGGFPNIRASEDSLFCLKASEYQDLIYIPDARVYHIFREDVPDFLSNQFLIGKYIYLYRKKYYNSFFLRKPILYFLAPFMLAYKFTRRFWLIMKAGPSHYVPFIKSFKYFLKGTLSWFKGFISWRNDQNELDNIVLRVN